MPPLRGSVKFQCSSTKRCGVSAWVSMTMALEWTRAGSVIFVICLVPVAGVACACKKEAQRSRSVDVPATRGDCVGVGRVLLRMGMTIVAIALAMDFEDNRGCRVVIS